jgi:hypothetical protein
MGSRLEGERVMEYLEKWLQEQRDSRALFREQILQEIANIKMAFLVCQVLPCVGFLLLCLYVDLSR